MLRKMIVVGTLVLGFASVAGASTWFKLPSSQPAAKTVPAGITVAGKIDQLGSNYIKVLPTGTAGTVAAEQSIAVDQHTLFFLDGRLANVGELRPGMTVEVWKGTNGKATLVRAKSAASGSTTTPAPATPRSGY